jgi:Lon protease-like protein
MHVSFIVAMGVQRHMGVITVTVHRRHHMRRSPRRSPIVGTTSHIRTVVKCSTGFKMMGARGTILFRRSFSVFFLRGTFTVILSTDGRCI